MLRSKFSVSPSESEGDSTPHTRTFVDAPTAPSETEPTARHVTLTLSQRRLLETLAAMPKATSTQLADALGVQGSTVRDGLTRLRRALDLGPEGDIVATARAGGVLPPVPPMEVAELATVRTGSSVAVEEGG